MVKKSNYDLYQKFVEELVDTDTIITNSGVFEYKGKKYILIAEVKEIKNEHFESSQSN